jgi:hypothetical protein
MNLTIWTPMLIEQTAAYNSKLPQGGLQVEFVTSNLLVSFGKQEAVGILNPALMATCVTLAVTGTTVGTEI